MGGAVGFVGYEYVQRIETTIPPAGETLACHCLFYADGQLCNF